MASTKTKPRRTKRQLQETNYEQLEHVEIDETNGDPVGVNLPGALLYVVERVCGKKIVKGSIQYLIKWKDYDESVNSWEPLENLACPELIEEYESTVDEKPPSKKSKKRPPEPKQPKLANVSKKMKSVVIAPSTSKAAAANQPLPFLPMTRYNTGFNRGLPPKHILHATDSAGVLMFLMEWEGTEEFDLVPAREANYKCPQLVIKFYESLIENEKANFQQVSFPRQPKLDLGSQLEIEEEDFQTGHPEPKESSFQSKVMEPEKSDEEQERGSQIDDNEPGIIDEEVEESDLDDYDPNPTLHLDVDEYGVIRGEKMTRLQPSGIPKAQKSLENVRAAASNVTQSSDDEAMVGLIRPIDQQLLMSDRSSLGLSEDE